MLLYHIFSKYFICVMKIGKLSQEMLHEPKKIIGDNPEIFMYACHVRNTRDLNKFIQKGKWKEMQRETLKNLGGPFSFCDICISYAYIVTCVAVLIIEKSVCKTFSICTHNFLAYYYYRYKRTRRRQPILKFYETICSQVLSSPDLLRIT